MSEGEKVGAVLVVGGGIASMQASLDLAESGFKVYLIPGKNILPYLSEGIFLQTCCDISTMHKLFDFFSIHLRYSFPGYLQYPFHPTCLFRTTLY